MQLPAFMDSNMNQIPQITKHTKVTLTLIGDKIGIVMIKNFSSLLGEYD
jgi:hypothetical protein